MAENGSVIQSAQNTFGSALVMDLSPTTVSNTSLVGALNATLLTGNGNEMSLQQDMGNGRVETAFLPEGYVPVGSCEFGDIVYIVSYNPLENKSQIGCFPSPERNISSDETLDPQQSLVCSEFQKLYKNEKATGKLETTSVKKIIYATKNMNPGDKYIIYTDTGAFSEENIKRLTDYGNSSHQMGEWPKLLRISVVSIEDSGKIVDLGASVKWYDNDYYINYEYDSQGNIDLDSYRSLVSSAYSVFSSKVSGKLAVLAELETFDSFGCAYEVYVKDVDVTGEDGHGFKVATKKRYDIWFYTSWGTQDYDINPMGFVITKSEWTTEENGGKLYMPYWDEDLKKYQYDYYGIEYKEDGSGWDYSTEGEALAVPVPTAEKNYAEESESEEIGWDYDAVYRYYRTYCLEYPPQTYADYLKESLDTLLPDIIDWKKEKEDDDTYSYTAVVLPSGKTYDDLRLVTKVTRLTGDDNEPDENKYVYNLDSVGYKEDGTIGYYTKLKDGSMAELNRIKLADDVVNDWFGKDIPRRLQKEADESFTLVTSVMMASDPDDSDHQTEETEYETGLERMVWNYEVAPVMPYGVLDYMAVSGQIDFSKIGKGIINLVIWKYYNSGTVSTLKWGLEAYTEPNMGIAGVNFDFYDNQGFAAGYHVTGKTTYAGTFTESIVMGSKGTNYRLDGTDSTGISGLPHAGDSDPNGTVWLDADGKPTWDSQREEGGEMKDNEGPFIDDNGVINPNILYLVRITVKYCAMDILGNYDTDNTSQFRYFYRWYWTNGMFNDQYYSIDDFDVLKPQLFIDTTVTFDTRGSDKTRAMTANTFQYTDVESLVEKESYKDVFNTLGANVYAINQDGADDSDGNILMTADPYITESWSTFYLDDKNIDMIKVKLMLCNSSITKSVQSPALVHGDGGSATSYDDIIQPVTGKLCSHDESGNPCRYYDRSGYVSYRYGANNCEVSKHFLSMLGVDEFIEYDEDVDDPCDAPLELNVQPDIYTSEDDKDYEAYTAYLDSFSLNIVGGTLEYGTVQYYDTNGNLIENESGHYTQVMTDMNELREEGTALVLAGIAFSKIFCTQMKENSGAKTLRSVVYDASGFGDEQSQTSGYIYPAESDSLAMIGLHPYWNANGYGYMESSRKEHHLYFDHAIGLMCGAHLNGHHRIGTFWSNFIYDLTWYSFQGLDGQGNTDKETTSNQKASYNDYDDEFLQESWQAHCKSLFAAFVITKELHTSHTFSTNYSFNSIKTAFGYETVSDSEHNRIHNVTDDIPKSYPSSGSGNWTDSDRRIIHTIAVKDSGNQGLVIPLSDWFISASTSGYQVRANTSGESVPTLTLADMLGSLFAQLYVYDSKMDFTALSFNDVTTLESYTEYWNKDIVMDMEVVQDEEGKEDRRTIVDLIGIQKIKMGSYIDNTFANSGIYRDDVNDYNIDVQIPTGRKSVCFQFGVPYDTGDLRERYALLSEARNRILLSYSDDGTSLRRATFRGDVTANTFYTWDESMGADRFSSSSALYYAESFGVTDDDMLYMTPGETQINTTSFSALADTLGYADGYVTFTDYTKLRGSDTTYDICYKQQGGDHNTHIEKIPLISMFNLFKPN